MASVKICKSTGKIHHLTAPKTCCLCSHYIMSDSGKYTCKACESIRNDNQRNFKYESSIHQLLVMCKDKAKEIDKNKSQIDVNKALETLLKNENCQKKIQRIENGVLISIDVKLNTKSTVKLSPSSEMDRNGNKSVSELNENRKKLSKDDKKVVNTNKTIQSNDSKLLHKTMISEKPSSLHVPRTPVSTPQCTKSEEFISNNHIIPMKSFCPNCKNVYKSNNKDNGIDYEKITKRSNTSKISIVPRKVSRQFTENRKLSNNQISSNVMTNFDSPIVEGSEFEINSKKLNSLNFQFSKNSLNHSDDSDNLYLKCGKTSASCYLEANSEMHEYKPFKTPSISTKYSTTVNTLFFNENQSKSYNNKYSLKSASSSKTLHSMKPKVKESVSLQNLTDSGKPELYSTTPTCILVRKQLSPSSKSSSLSCQSEKYKTQSTSEKSMALNTDDLYSIFSIKPKINHRDSDNSDTALLTENATSTETNETTDAEVAPFTNHEFSGANEIVKGSSYTDTSRSDQNLLNNKILDQRSQTASIKTQIRLDENKKFWNLILKSGNISIKSTEPVNIGKNDFEHPSNHRDVIRTKSKNAYDFLNG